MGIVEGSRFRRYRVWGLEGLGVTRSGLRLKV